MNPEAIIAAITAVIGEAVALAPTAIKLEQIIEPVAMNIWNNLVNKKVITQSDLDALMAQSAALSASIQAPLPPEQPDDI